MYLNGQHFSPSQIFVRSKSHQITQEGQADTLFAAALQTVKKVTGCQSLLLEREDVPRDFGVWPAPAVPLFGVECLKGHYPFVYFWKQDTVLASFRVGPCKTQPTSASQAALQHPSLHFTHFVFQAS